MIDYTRAVYKPLEESSLLDLWFPMLPTPSKLKKLWGYTSLHWSLQSILNSRRRTGRVENDAMQMMMDSGVSDPLISLGIIGAILAGVFNTSINAAWNLCYLAQDPVWMAKIRTEVDGVLDRRRISQSEAVVDILQRLMLEDWEREFPLLELALKETLRFVMSGTIVRKNIGGKDVLIGETDYVIPRNSLAVYSSADAHMNGQIYEDPLRWDPSRHCEHRAEGTRTPHSFLGWGSGNHPCPAMRFAKLNIIVPTVMFIVCYDFEMCDREGTKVTKPLPKLNFDRVGAGRPSQEVYMKCRVRVQE
ncbi:Fc.00g116310.m01.CDS01 [Cosmosporella sp. VM-42]